MGLASIIITVAILNFDRLTSSKPTVAQSAYFQTQLNQVEYIEIRTHPKSGGDVLATLRTPSQVTDIKTGIKLDRIHAPTGSFGRIDLIFYRADGSEFRINYSPEKDRIKFENPWGIEGLAFGDLATIIDRVCNQSVSME